jgi:outer membrane protein assembly factor BamD (BamD/ComL family)
MATQHSSTPSISDQPRFVTDDADLFWEKNKTLILATAAIVLIALIGTGIWWQQRFALQNAATELAATGNTAEVWQKVVDQYPTTPAASLCYIHLASAAQQKADYAKALGYYETFLKNFPKHPATPAVQFTRAQLLEATNQPDQAKAAYLTILQARPAQPFAGPAGINLARIYEAAGDLTKARETLQAVLVAKGEGAAAADAQRELDRLKNTFPQAQ